MGLATSLAGKLSQRLARSLVLGNPSPSGPSANAVITDSGDNVTTDSGDNIILSVEP